MILLLRGHIRNSFFDNKLYNLIKSIYDFDNNLIIYIHTWNVFSNNISWREISIDNSHVNEKLIFKYFSDLKHLIKKIIIDDDSKILLNGNLEGKINNWRTPIIGWKNYWYGKFKLVEYVYNNYKCDNHLVINTRFDILSNFNSKNINNDLIINFLKDNVKKNFEKNIFLNENFPHHGIDNFYLGNINTMYLLSNYFHNSLDYILKKNSDVLITERIVFLENNIIFK